MGDQERTKQPVQEHRPVAVDGVAPEEDIDQADVVERAGTDPQEQLSRPDQPDFDPEERRQYDDPAEERPIAEAETPEDR